jgi:hypothetical protein
MTHTRVHVFTGEFAHREAACEYSEAQWEPEPDESISDEEYRRWEDRNPTWQMKSDLGGLYLDSDFIETVMSDEVDWYKYLGGYLTEPDAAARVLGGIDPRANTLVSIFEEALGGHPLNSPMKSTAKLAYCGYFACKL